MAWLNWFLGAGAIVLWLGATGLYFRRDIAKRLARRRKPPPKP